MTFTLNIECAGSAFADPNLEIARILRKVAHKLDEYPESMWSGVCLDSNGNAACDWGLSITCPVDGVAVELGECCRECGVMAGAPCPSCGESMYHFATCPALEELPDAPYVMRPGE